MILSSSGALVSLSVGEGRRGAVEEEEEEEDEEEVGAKEEVAKEMGRGEG